MTQLEEQQAYMPISERSQLIGATQSALREVQENLVHKYVLFLNDSNYYSLDTLRALTEHQYFPDGVCQRVGIAVHSGETITEQDIIDLHGGAELDNYCKAQVAVLTLGREVEGWGEITNNSNLMGEMESIANDEGQHGYGAAQCLLEQTLPEYSYEYLEPVISGARPAIPGDPSSANAVNNTPFRAFPNPAQDILYIEFRDGSTNIAYGIEIHNLLGQKLISKDVGAGVAADVPISTLPNGIYFVNIKENGQKKWTQLIQVSR